MGMIKVVKYNGGPDVFAWKYPSEDLGNWTQLIVNESQEAILYKGGQAFDLFASGRHILDTANIPLLNNIINLPFGGESPFTAEVWYVNKAYSLDIKWGTPTPIQIQDPKYKLFVPVRSFGQFGIQIDDSRKFLGKLVGTLSVFGKESIIKYFKGLYLTKVKDAISSFFIKKKISILEINAYLEEISEYLKESISPVMDEYGVKLVNFYVNDINVPEDDIAVSKLKAALAKKAEMDIVGYDYVQERSFDTLEGAATNPGSAQASMLGASIGLGMGTVVGGALGNQIGVISQNLNTKYATKVCPNCKNQMESEKRFCSLCGYDTSINKEEKKNNNVKIKCDKCGCEIGHNMKFCPQCGGVYNPCPKCKEDVPDGMSICPKCGFEMPRPCPKCGNIIENNNAKFCIECGFSLIKKCSKCNAEIKNDSKFCSECGNKL